MKFSARLLLILILCGTADSIARSEEPASSRSLFTSHTRFRLPFQFDAAEMQRMGAQDVHLYCSEDQGQTWQEVQQVAPEAGGFALQISADGEYWFAIRTRGADTQLYPRLPLPQSCLKVVVDSAPPELDVQLHVTGADQLQVQWAAHDPHLSEIRLHYLLPGAVQWTHLPTGNQAAGSASLRLQQPGLVLIKGVAVDRSGNARQAHAELQLASGSARQPQIMNSSYQNAASQPAEYEIQIVPRTKVQARAAGPTPPPTAPMITGAAVKWVGKSAFGLHYTTAGPPRQVSLYVTDNGGQKWWHYGEDADLRSPFQVQVPRDGQYGFAIRTTDEFGNRPPAPQSGDAPEMVIQVDTTPPAAQLLPLQQGFGQYAGQLLIRWSVSDRNLPERPIQLFWSGSPTGPWQPMGESLPNSGQHLWNFADRLNQPTYVRLSVTDNAGNVTSVDSLRPDAAPTETARAGE